MKTNGTGLALSTDASRGAARLVTWAMEGTQPCGLGLVRYLASHGHQAAAIDAARHINRRRAGKSDPIDAVGAARELLARPYQAPMLADGDREIMRLLMLDRDNAVASAKTARAEGKTDREIRRCIKRYLARHLYRALAAIDKI
jgi:transposase